MLKRYFKAFILCSLIFILSSTSIIFAKSRAIDYSSTVNTDFTDGRTVKITHMCGTCRDASDLTELLDTGVSYYHKIRIDNMVNTLIPKPLVDSFRYSGHKLYLTSRDIREYEGSDIAFEPAGAYSSKTKTIYLSNKYNNSWAEYALLHEFGHYLDFEVKNVSGLNKRVSDTQDFINIWNKEKDKLQLDSEDNEEYFKSSATEYFAQAFKEYATEPQRLKLNTPNTYNFIVDCLNLLEMSTCRGI